LYSGTASFPRQPTKHQSKSKRGSGEERYHHLGSQFAHVATAKIANHGKKKGETEKKKRPRQPQRCAAPNSQRSSHPDPNSKKPSDMNYLGPPSIVGKHRPGEKAAGKKQ
jgi:hypothetical protein